MTRLQKSLCAWGTADFNQVLKRELQVLPPDILPLQAGLSASSYALDDRIDVMVIGTSANDRYIQATVGVFYKGLTAGCSCADDPTPVEPQNEYTEVELTIDRVTADSVFRLRK